MTNDSVVGEQLCWKRNDTTKFSEKCSTQEAQPPSGTADPLLGGKVDHLRPAWTGPLLPLKFLTLATLMPGCPDKYKHLVRDSSIYENQEPRTQNWGKTQRRSHPKPLGGGKSSDTRRGSFWKESFVLDNDITANDMCVHMQINLVLPWLSHTTDFSYHILPPVPLLSMESHSLWLTTSPFCHNFSTLPSFYNFAQVLRQYGSVVVILPVVVIIAIHDT